MEQIEKIQNRINKGTEKQRKTIDAINDLYRKQAKLIAPIQKQMAQATMQVNKAFKEQSRNVRAITDSYSGLNRSLVRTAALSAVAYKAIDKIIDIAQSRIGAAILGGSNIGRLVSQSLPAGVSGQKALDVLSATLKQSQLLQFRADASQVAAINKLTGELSALSSEISGGLISSFVGSLSQSDVPKFLQAVQVDSRKAISDFANISNVEIASQLSNALSLVSQDQQGALDPLTKAALDASKSIESLKAKFESVADKLTNRLLPAIESVAGFVDGLSPNQTLGLGIGAGIAAIAGPSLAWNAGKAIVGTGARGVAAGTRGVAAAGGAAARAVGSAYTGLGVSGSGLALADSIATGVAGGGVLAAPIVLGSALYTSSLESSSAQFAKQLDISNPQIKKLLEQADKFHNQGDPLRARRSRIDAQILNMTPSGTQFNIGSFGQVQNNSYTPQQERALQRLREQRRVVADQIEAQQAVTVTTDRQVKSYFSLEKSITQAKDSFLELAEKVNGAKAPGLSTQPASNLSTLQDASLALTEFATTLSEQQAQSEIFRLQKQYKELLPMGSMFALPELNTLNASLDEQVKTLEQMLKIAQADSSQTGRMRQYDLQAQILSKQLEKRQNNRFLIEAMKDAAIGEAIGAGAHFEKIVVDSNQNLLRGLQKNMIGLAEPVRSIVAGSNDPWKEPQMPRTIMDILEQAGLENTPQFRTRSTTRTKTLGNHTANMKLVNEILTAMADDLDRLQKDANEPIAYRRAGRQSNIIP